MVQMVRTGHLAHKDRPGLRARVHPARLVRPDQGILERLALLVAAPVTTLECSHSWEAKCQRTAY